MHGRLVLVFLVLAAGLPLAAQHRPPAPSTFSLPVPDGQTTLDALGIRPYERGVALDLLARGLHGVSGRPAGFAGMPESLAELAAGWAGPGTKRSASALTVLAPLTDDAWRRALGIDANADLFARLVTNRGALLVAAGSLAADASLRQLLITDRALLRDVVRLAPGSFAVLAPALRVADGRINVPGGAPAVDAWAALAGAAPAAPAAFIRGIVTRDEGRLSRFYATLATLDPGAVTALLPPRGGAVEIAALSQLYAVARDAEPAWSVDEHPYQRGPADLWMALQTLPAARALPASARWWPAVFSHDITTRDDALHAARSAAGSPAYSDIIKTLLDANTRERRDRLMMAALAQRRFPAAEEAAAADTMLAVGGYRRYPALIVALDRIGIVRPSTWAAMVEAAAHVDRGSGRTRIEGITLLQGCVALVDRARLVRSIGTRTADSLLTTLARAAGRRPVAPAIARWIVDDLMPALPPLVQPDAFTGRTAYESRVLQAMAGPMDAASARIVEWEGLRSVLDITGAEHTRLLRIRGMVPSPGLDAALADGKADHLASALVALAYTPALGDPDGAVTLSPDVVARHRYGIGSAPTARESAAWEPPIERTGTGQPWHVEGALLGLDVALARLSLRRMGGDEVPAIPTINLNDLLTLAHTVVAMTPHDLDDATRDELAAAIARGRQRLTQASGTDALAALAREAGLSAPLQEGLSWMTAQDPSWVRQSFSLRDLLWLGRPSLDTAAVDTWGVYSAALDGHAGTRMAPARSWEAFSGRADAGIFATQVPDLTLRLVEETARLRLPAPLVPALLAYATMDYWHDVDARFADDWAAMTQTAMALSAARIEDYVAALASGGPLGKMGIY